MIDVTVLVGASPRHGMPDAYGVDAMSRELVAHGVASALVAARSGAGYRHEVGNSEVLALAGRTSGVRIYPVASINPVQYLDWRVELERALAGGAIAIRLFPEEQGWNVESEAFDAIAAVLRGRCPLLLPVSRFGDASRIGRASAALGLPVVLLGGHYTQLADCLAALERWPHLYLDTSRLGQFRGVETVVRAVGPERLLFGSGAPARPIQAALNAVGTSDIPPEAMRAILSDNAGRLFGLPAEPFDLPQPTRAVGLVDVHGHIGALPFSTPAPEHPTQFVEAMAWHGVQHTVASSIRAILDDAHLGNREAYAAVEACGSGLSAYVVVNPNDPDGSCRAMDDAYARDTAIGAKLHCQWSGQPTASPTCVGLVREVARRGRPLKIHVHGDGWGEALVSVARDYPGWKMIVAHGGPGTPSLEGARAVEHTDNVYLELATTFADLPVAREVVRRVGRDRLLFGSDAPLIDPGYVLGIYADAGADLARTTANAHEVFGR